MSHTKRELLTPRIAAGVGTRMHYPQVDHSGTHRSVTAPVGTFNPNDRTHLNEHVETHGYTGGKPPKPKNHSHVPVDGGMHRQTKDGLLTGITETSVRNSPDASGACPLDPTVSKRLTPPKYATGMKSRTNGGLNEDAHHELGRRILAEATRT